MLLYIEMTFYAAAADRKERNVMTPVETHGKLRVEGTHIVDKNGEIFQLRGCSTHGIAWYPGILTEDAFRTLRDEWNVNTIRLAMYVEEAGYDNCYMDQKEHNLLLVKKGIDLCVRLGLYVIVDWHILIPGNPQDRKEDAKAFFTEIATAYPNCPNIIFEICNEPNGRGINWTDVIRPYCVELTETIRPLAPETIIIAGTATWSQDVDDAMRNPLPDQNTVYAVHYYAATHKQGLRDRVKACYDLGCPILISEFGVCDASGDGVNDFKEAQLWFDLLDELQIGYINWAYGNKKEACCIFLPTTDIGKGSWSDEELTESGQYMKKYFSTHA